jgi:hypothetical protein
VNRDRVGNGAENAGNNSVGDSVKKRYQCSRFPWLAIGNKVKFQAGAFETADPELQALIESNDWFDVHIVEVQD